MLPHSGAYLFVFLPGAVLAYWSAFSRPGLRTLVLVLAGGLFYYLAAGLPQLALLLTATLVTFGAARALIASPVPSRRKLGLGVLMANVVLLLFFKLQAPLFGAAALALPLGLSFYTFNLVSYGLDVYSRRTAPAPSLGALASFSIFFPTVSAGPLLRFGDFEAQRASPPPFDAGLLEMGLVSLVVGLAKKVLVADPLGAAVGPLFASWEQLGLRDAWLAVLGYAYQLYFDFSGYTDMAIGAGALLGIRVPQNFNAPYTAVHITDFWQRWHMTMSRWFRDYLFLPLSRELLRRRPSLEGADRVRSLCLIFTMVAIGLWHGSTWTFLAWGLFHGLLLAGHAHARVAWRLPIPSWASRAMTFVAVLIGWVLLRSPSPAMTLHIWGAMAGLHGWGEPVAGSGGWLAAAVVLLLVSTNTPLEAYLVQPRRTAVRSWALAVLLALSLMSMGGRSQFLYFQF